MSRPHGINTNASGTGSRLDPTATDFTPATSTPSKRKASSSARSALSFATTVVADPQHGQIFIPGEQLLGRDPSPSPPNSKSTGGDWEAAGGEFGRWSDLRGDAMFEYDDMSPLSNMVPPSSPGAGRPGFGRRPNNPQPYILGLHNSAARRSRAQKPAVILVQTDGPAPPSDDAGQARGQIPFLPLYQHREASGEADTDIYTILPSHTIRIWRKIDTSTTQKPTATWPSENVPVELFELIATHLARDDIKSMRLVNKEFERKVCQSLFRTSVVPFNTELYDMISDQAKTSSRRYGLKDKGKRKMKATDHDADSWGWRNAKEDKEGKVYHGHGLRVFQGFGPYIRRFGMSFEVSETSLALPPGKHVLDPVESYYGTYQWPTINYARFAKLNRLEETADETSRMKAAFSNLTMVSELGLSVRNGLGWLQGPDRSFRASLLQRPAAVFGSSHEPKDRRTKSARAILSFLRQAVARASPCANFKEMTLEQRTLNTPFVKISGLSGTPFASTRLWQTMDRSVLGGIEDAEPSPDGFKVLCANTELSGAANIGELDLNPNDLKKEQKEWLMETEWAQRAFLESYILAVMDNPAAFSQVTTLNMSTLSSGLLHMISRGVFWDALPSLSSCTLHVSPDWRTVEKDEASYAETKLRNPSEAIRAFIFLLNDQIARREHIVKLDIGWVDGGEHAQGMFARNANLLPAPVASLDQCTVTNPMNLLALPHVEHLTLSNCWISPPMLQRFVNAHSSNVLQKLTLNSVSLTAHPRTSPQAQQAQAAAAAMMGNLQGQLQQNNPALFAGNAPGQAQQVALAQQFQNQMQQFFGNAPPPPPPPPVNGPATANPNAFPIAPFVPGQQWHPPAFAGNLPPWHHQAQHGVFQPSLSNATHWMNDHRQGCWPELLNKISPGPTFSDYLPAPQPWDEERPPRPSTNLQTIELISCGYARLDHNTSFDQTDLVGDGLDFGRERIMSSWFRARYCALKPYMLDASQDKHLGTIVQWIPQREVDAMRYAWGLRMGWEDREKAEEAEFDGWYAGGSGRVSGFIEKGMPLMTHHVQHAMPGGHGLYGQVEHFA